MTPAAAGGTWRSAGHAAAAGATIWRGVDGCHNKRLKDGAGAWRGARLAHLPLNHTHRLTPARAASTNLIRRGSAAVACRSDGDAAMLSSQISSSAKRTCLLRARTATPGVLFCYTTCTLPAPLTATTRFPCYHYIGTETPAICFVCGQGASAGRASSVLTFLEPSAPWRACWCLVAPVPGSTFLLSLP